MGRSGSFAQNGAAFIGCGFAFFIVPVFFMVFFISILPWLPQSTSMSFFYFPSQLELMLLLPHSLRYSRCSLQRIRNIWNNSVFLEILEDFFTLVYFAIVIAVGSCLILFLFFLFFFFTLFISFLLLFSYVFFLYRLSLFLKFTLAF